MAIFKKKNSDIKKSDETNKIKTKKQKVSKDFSSKPKKVSGSDLSWVLLSPRVTEKSAIKSEDKVYVFNVHKHANKLQIKEAIAKKFDIKPLKVNVSNVNSKPVFRKGVKGKTPEGKKAYVYLSKKDNIQFV